MRKIDVTSKVLCYIMFVFLIAAIVASLISKNYYYLKYEVILLLVYLVLVYQLRDVKIAKKTDDLMIDIMTSGDFGTTLGCLAVLAIPLAILLIAVFI